MASKVQETVKQEVRDVAETAAGAVKSTAYLYPLRGIVYFISHRDLWKPLLSRLAPTLALGTGVTALMFAFTYLPQLAVLVFTSGPLAALTTALLVLSESSTLTMVLSKTLLIGDSLVDTFDGTLIAKGQSPLVARERQVKSGRAGDAIARLGKLAVKPLAKFTPAALVRYVMYLPLNFIPVVGTAFFVLLQGQKSGPNALARYFQLKGMGRAQKEKLIEERKGAFTSFGVVATLLEMVPVAGVLFAFTNTCGAALWAADMEKETETHDGTSPALREQAKKAA